MNNFNGKTYHNIAKRKLIIINNKVKILKYKYYIHFNYHQYLLNIISVLYIIIIIFPNYLAKNIYRHLSELNQIKLTINTKGFIQILGSSFSTLPSTVTVNGYTKNLDNKKINLTSTQNTVIMKWNSSFTDCSYMFSGLSSINQIDLSSFTSSSVEKMDYMFYNCQQLSKIILSGFKTSKAISMKYMFSSCNSLTSLDLSSFNTSLVTDISYMFYDCIILSSLKIVGFLNSLTTNMRGIFQNCNSLKSIDLSQFFTPNAKVFWDMFNGCISLISLDLSTFDTSNVGDMESMFDGCESLVSINLNHFNTSKVYFMNKMFRNCYKLEYVYMKNIQVISSLTMEYMFYGCSNLKYIDLYSINQIANDIDYMFSYTSGNFTFCVEDETRITDIFNILYGLTKTKRDCSNNCYPQNRDYFPETKKCVLNCTKNNTHQFLYNNNCYSSCPKRTNHLSNSYICEDLNCNYYYNYEQTGCISTIEDGYFSNSSSLKTIDKCHEDCQTCNQKGTIDNANCLTCPEGKFYNYGNCISNCTNGYYEENSIKKCKCSNIKCFKCSLESLNYDLCITCNENYFPKYEEYNTGSYIDC